ncbi:MAG TPA: acyl-CoA dehydrogenase family protein [Spirochaetia bacterium]|nr:acyl-CoA dehydrogenase family protein [Spirochaetia bacterium]HTZ50945.1 acyl-CoA dehydrogenase family protein [Spirochaetia bacterium]
MNYFLTDDQKMIRDLAAQIAREKIAPIAAEFDESGEFPWEIVKTLAQADLYRVFIPTEYDGLGGGVFEMCLVVEELSRACGGISLCYAASALGTIPIILYGTEEQKKKYLPKLAAGEIVAAFGLTEAGAGSDAAGIKTTAKPDGDSYVINGTKQWITNGGEASIYTVIALTDPARGVRGSSAILVEKDHPGFTFGKKENKMGIRASATRELVFQDCRVPKSALLGKEGQGFLVAMRTLDQSRPGVASQALGIAQGALDKAVEYSRERQQFGKPISAFQGMQFMLADMATQVEAARALTYAAAKSIDAGEKDVSRMSAMAKVFASDTAMKVTTDAVQVLGGYGYMKEYPVEKMMRDAKITQIYEGTNQIQREVIGLGLIKESVRARK